MLYNETNVRICETVITTSLSPTEKHLTFIEKWLIKEWTKTNKGFYSNWAMIQAAFEEKRLSIITENGKALGFVVYRIYDLYSVIDIAEIKPSERRKGIAKKLIHETLDFFKSKGALATQLFCYPENSEPFWQRIGFINFPEFYRNSRIKMYQLLVETLPLTNDLNAKTAVRLWNNPPNQAKNIEPDWVWTLIFSKNKKTLSKPIVFPVENNWKIEFIRNGETTFMDEIKYYNIDIADYGDFLIIREINL